MEPRIQTPAVRRGWRERRRNHEAVTLHPAIDARNITADHETGRPGPRRFATIERIRLRLPFLERYLGARYVVRLEKFVVPEREADGLFVDGDVGRERIPTQFLYPATEPRESGFQSGPVSRGRRHAGRRDRANLGNERKRGGKRHRQEAHSFHGRE